MPAQITARRTFFPTPPWIVDGTLRRVSGNAAPLRYRPAPYAMTRKKNKNKPKVDSAHATADGGVALYDVAQSTEPMKWVDGEEGGVKLLSEPTPKPQGPSRKARRQAQRMVLHGLDIKNAQLAEIAAPISPVPATRSPYGNNGTGSFGNTVAKGQARSPISTTSNGLNVNSASFVPINASFKPTTISSPTNHVLQTPASLPPNNQQPYRTAPSAFERIKETYNLTDEWIRMYQEDHEFRNWVHNSSDSSFFGHPASEFAALLSGLGGSNNRSQALGARSHPLNDQPIQGPNRRTQKSADYGSSVVPYDKHWLRDTYRLPDQWIHQYMHNPFFRNWAHSALESPLYGLDPSFDTFGQAQSIYSSPYHRMNAPSSSPQATATNSSNHTASINEPQDQPVSGSRSPLSNQSSLLTPTNFEMVLNMSKGSLSVSQSGHQTMTAVDKTLDQFRRLSTAYTPAPVASSDILSDVEKKRLLALKSLQANAGKQKPANNKKDKTAAQQHLRRSATPWRSNSPHRGSSSEPVQVKIKLPPPKIHPQYFQIASQPSARLTKRRQLLIILDLNGTLILRPKTLDGRPTRSQSSYVMRPYLKTFLEYVFKHHKVVFWSSANRQNVRKMIDHCVTPQHQKQIVLEWARDKMDIPEKFLYTNCVTYKRLNRVWEALDKTGICKFDQTNTILVDDDEVKAMSHPLNHLKIPDFDEDVIGGLEKDDALQGVAGFLEELSFQSNVSNYIRDAPYKHGMSKWTAPWATDLAFGNLPYVNDRKVDRYVNPEGEEGDDDAFSRCE